MFDYDSFHHPVLPDHKHNAGTCLGTDSWDDTTCAGKYSFVEEFFVGKAVTASGLSPDLGTIGNLPVSNALYAHDTENGENILLESNNAIYLGENMFDLLINPIQAEEEYF